MRIKVLVSLGIMIDGQILSPAPGEVIDVPDEEAQQLIDAELAEAVEAEQKPKKK